MAITTKQRAYLRGLAHPLDPIVLTGEAGLSDEVLAKVKTELVNHELLKVRIGDGPIEVREAADQLVAATEAELVQIIGHIVILYKRRKKDPAIRLPKTQG